MGEQPPFIPAGVLTGQKKVMGSCDINDNDERWDMVKRGRKVMLFVQEDLVRRLVAEKLGLDPDGCSMHARFSDKSGDLREVESFEMSMLIEKQAP